MFKTVKKKFEVKIIGLQEIKINILDRYEVKHILKKKNFQRGDDELKY